MAYPALTFTVMLAAPSDLKDELEVMREVALKWSSVHSRSRQVVLLPMDYVHDTYPEVQARPQDTVNRQLLDKCDILIAAFWTRLGSPTGTHSSGTVEEIERQVTAGRPVMLYFSNRLVAPSGLDEEQSVAVKEYKRKMEGKSFYHVFDSPDDLRVKLTDDLARLVNENAYIRAQLQPYRAPGPQVLDTEHDLSEMSKRVLATAARAPDDAEGRVLVSRVDQGTGLSAGRKQIVSIVLGRREAEVEATLEELEMHGLVATQDIKRQVFYLTKRGYDVADGLPDGYSL
jgi:hypothetical protein